MGEDKSELMWKEENLQRKMNKWFILNNINQEERIKIKDKYNWLKMQNEDIADTINFEILTSKYDELVNVLNVVTLYPDIQKQIVKLNNNKFKFFSTIVNNYDKNGYDWISLAEDVLNRLSTAEYNILFNDEEFKSRINDIYNKSKQDKLTEKDEKELDTMTSLFVNENMFSIGSYKDLKNFNSNKRYDDLLTGKVEDENGYFKELNEIDKLKHVILLKEFGHGIYFAKNFFKKYFGNYDEIINVIDNQDEKEIYNYLVNVKGLSSPEEIQSEVARIKKENTTIKEYMKAIKNIIDTDDINKLKQCYLGIEEKSPRTSKYLMDSIMRKFFCRMINKELYQIKKEDEVSINSVKAYMIKDDFKILMSSLDSYSKALDLDCKKISNHVTCNSLIANNNIGTAPIDGACLGYINYSENSLYNSAPWDLGSAWYAEDFNIARRDAKFFDIKFYLPNHEINNTRRRHNENMYERRELDNKKVDYEKGKFKKQPSYALYFSEVELKNYFKTGFNNKNVILTSENFKKYLNMDKLYNEKYRVKLIEKDIKEKERERRIWEASLKEANKRNVDIVIVDRTYMALRERLKIDELENKIVNYDINLLNDKKEMQKFLDLIEELIVESENNRSGNNLRKDKDFGCPKSGELVHEEIREKLFSEEVMADRLNKIEKKIESLDSEKTKICYAKLKEITLAEREKYNHEHSYFEEEPGYNLDEYLKRISNKELGKKDNEIFDVLEKVDKKTGKTGGQIVCEAINDAKGLEEYEKTTDKIHGLKHINNVILFSYIIAKNENKLNSSEIDLVLQAAKFHDIGRDGIWNELGIGNREDGDDVKHAKPGALGAEFYMKKELDNNGNRKYSDEQIAMVQVAIAYHEVSEKNKNEFSYKVFNELCEGYGVSDSNKEATKLMCTYLKDADAIDRTRFMFVDPRYKEIECKQIIKKKINGKNVEYVNDKYIPEHLEYLRKYKDCLNPSYLRCSTSFVLVPEARKIHLDFLKKGDEYVYDKYGNVVNDYRTQEVFLPELLKKYEDIAENKSYKYKDNKREENISKFLNGKKQKELEEQRKLKKKKELEEQTKLKEQKELEKQKQLEEQDELRRICTYSMDKLLLAELRNLYKKVLQRIFHNHNNLER